MMKTEPSSKPNVTAGTPSDAELIEKLKAAPFYQVYQDAFRLATGLPLVLVSADRHGFNPCHASENQNPFCRVINTGTDPCRDCILAQGCVMREATARAKTIDCFAGMKETAVPVKLGKRIVGYLKTGQVLTCKPDGRAIAHLKKGLGAAGYAEGEIKELIAIFRRTPIIEPKRYAGMVTVLSAFGLQLASLLNRVLLESRKIDPAPVRKAKDYILRHIDERLSLEEIAATVNVSTYYFCKIFKQSTGMTFTEYVNRQRIELAKSEILKPDRRVTEVAYDVGYQSLSQFNRSFLKIVGESPTQFRKRVKSGSIGGLVA